jgi:hypothetical protein
MLHRIAIQSIFAMIGRDTHSNKICERGVAFAARENLGGCVAGCESDSIRAAVECVCARVHDAVRRANPNQFVMTLFSSQASLARRRALRNEISLGVVCVCARVYKRVLNIQGKRACERASERRSYLLLLHPVSSLAAFNLHDMPPASPPLLTSVFVFNLHGARPERCEKCENKRAAMNGNDDWKKRTPGSLRVFVLHPPLRK